MSDQQQDPTVSDDDSSNQGLPDPKQPHVNPRAVEDPNYLADFEVVSDSVAERSDRLDRTEFGEDATTQAPPALIDVDDAADGEDVESELLADTGDSDDSPEASAMHIVEE